MANLESLNCPEEGSPTEDLFNMENNGDAMKKVEADMDDSNVAIYSSEKQHSPMTTKESEGLQVVKEKKAKEPSKKTRNFKICFVKIGKLSNPRAMSTITRPEGNGARNGNDAHSLDGVMVEIALEDEVDDHRLRSKLNTKGSSWSVFKKMTNEYLTERSGKMKTSFTWLVNRLTYNGATSSAEASPSSDDEKELESTSGLEEGPVATPSLEE